MSVQPSHASYYRVHWKKKSFSEFDIKSTEHLKAKSCGFFCQFDRIYSEKASSMKQNCLKLWLKMKRCQDSCCIQTVYIYLFQGKLLFRNKSFWCFPFVLTLRGFCCVLESLFHVPVFTTKAAQIVSQFFPYFCMYAVSHTMVFLVVLFFCGDCFHSFIIDYFIY